MQTSYAPLQSTKIRLRTYALSGRIELLDRDAPLLQSAIKKTLDFYPDLILDFNGVEIGKCAASRLIGELIYSHGPQIMQRVRLSGCSAHTLGALFMAIRIARRDPDISVAMRRKAPDAQLNIRIIAGFDQPLGRANP